MVVLLWVAFAALDLYRANSLVVRNLGAVFMRTMGFVVKKRRKRGRRQLLGGEPEALGAGAEATVIVEPMESWSGGFVASSDSHGECVVCTDAAADYVLYPCGHKCVCGECAGLLSGQDCPICRKEIQDAIRVFST